MQRKYEYKTFSKNENLKQEDFLKVYFILHLHLWCKCRIRTIFNKKKSLKKTSYRKKKTKRKERRNTEIAKIQKFWEKTTGRKKK